MKAYERLAHAFAREGVKTVFGMMGAFTMHWYHARCGGLEVSTGPVGKALPRSRHRGE